MTRTSKNAKQLPATSSANATPSEAIAEAQKTKPPLPTHILEGLRSQDAGGHFGGCPECGRSTRFVSLRGDNWFVCRDHRTRWCIGNLFDTHDWEWKAWQTIERYLSFFREVEPVYENTES